MAVIDPLPRPDGPVELTRMPTGGIVTRFSRAVYSWLAQAYRILVAQQESGTTANRPVKDRWTGRRFFDTTLGKPVWWDGSSSWVTYGASAFTASFVSAEQTITAAGALTLAHGLGATPKLVSVRLVCKTSEHDYSIGDEVFANTFDADARGVSIVPDATNLNIRYSSNANTFVVLDKTTGANVNITNTSWRAVFYAWA